MTCDLAEVYHIFDAGAIPDAQLATLLCGLPEDSRLMRAMSGRRASTSEMLLAAIADRLSTLVWFKTEDGLKGRNRPASILERLTREREEKPYSVPVDRLQAEIDRIRQS